MVATTLGLIMLLVLITFTSFIYFSIMLRSKEVATLLVVMTVPLLLEHMKLAETSNLTSFSNILILKMCTLDFTIILSFFILFKIL